MKQRLDRLAAAILLIAAAIATPPARAGEPAFQRFASGAATAVDANLQAVRSDFVMAPAEAESLAADVRAALADGTAVRAVTFTLIVVIAGTGLEWLYWTFAAAPLRAVVTTTATNPRLAVNLALRRLVFAGFGLVSFAAATLGAAMLLAWPPNVAVMVIGATTLVLAVRSAGIVTDIIVSPQHPALRLAAIRPGRSRFIVAGIGWLTMLAASAILVPQLVATIGAAPHLAGAIRVGIGGLVAISLLAALSFASRPEDESRGRRRRRPRFPRAFVGAFAVVATAMLALAGLGRIAAAMVDIAIVATILAASKRIVFFFWRDIAASGTEPAGETLHEMLPLIVLSSVRFAALLIGIAGLILIAGVPLATFTTDANPLARLALRLIDTVALAFVAHLGWIAMRFAIDRRLRRLAPLDPHGASENTRLLTLLPLLRTTLLIVLLVLFGLSALWALGIQMAPLLAGAGIFGLAIGFGAQTLVRDVIAGVFFLIEDVFRIGEYIESGTTTKGAVEHISLRTVALRHHNGPLTFVPYGLLGTVKNDSRDWVIDKFNLPLPLSVDSEKIRKLIKNIGADMALDPELGQLIREPLKGKLYRVDPGIKIFRCKFMTTPGCQFELRAAALKLIEAALGESGISFAGGGPQTILVKRAPDP